MANVKLPRGGFDRFLEQERTPVCTVATLLTTAAGWVILILDLLHGPRDWGALAQVFVIGFVLVVGSLMNAVLGGIGWRRGEYGCGTLAMCGIGVWFATVILVYSFRGNSLWR
jgi:hypothetical protein